jgi:hypothetical protein
VKISRKFYVVVATVSVSLATSAAFAGVPPTAPVPEPTALLVWLGLAAAGGLLYSRRNRDER